MAAVINKRKCPAIRDICKVIAICPNGAVIYQADDSEPMGGKILIDEDLCDGCGLCVEACCGNAVVIN